MHSLVTVNQLYVISRLFHGNTLMLWIIHCKTVKKNRLGKWNVLTTATWWLRSKITTDVWVLLAFVIKNVGGGGGWSLLTIDRIMSDDMQKWLNDELYLMHFLPNFFHSFEPALCRSGFYEYFTEYFSLFRTCPFPEWIWCIFYRNIFPSFEPTLCRSGSDAFFTEYFSLFRTYPFPEWIWCIFYRIFFPLSNLPFAGVDIYLVMLHFKGLGHVCNLYIEDLDMYVICLSLELILNWQGQLWRVKPALY